MRPRSPIEMMVDKACGFDPATHVPAPVKPKDFSAIGDAMVEVCRLAILWQKHGRRYEMRLSSAISRLKELGF